MIPTRPISLRSALAACDRWHRHHAPPLGGLFAIGAFDGHRLVCVGIVSRPVARALDFATVAEVTRVASDGSTRGAASAIVRACAREALARGFRRVISYTLLGESGASYRAARWRPTTVTRGKRQWTTPARPRKRAAQPGRKIRWEFGPDAQPRCPRAWFLLPLTTRAPAQQEMAV